MKARTKLLLIFLPPLVAGWIMIDSLSVLAVRRTLEAQAAESARAGAGRIIDAYAEAFASGRESGILPALYSLKTALNASGVFLADASGAVAAHTDVAQKGKKLPPAQAGLARSGGFTADAGRPGFILVFIPVAAPAPKDPEELALLGAGARPRLGTLGVFVPLAAAEAAAKAISSRISAILFFVYAALLLGVFFLTGLALRPVRQLTEGTRRIRLGDYGARIPADSSDEFGELARSFNEMSATLSGTIVSKDYLDAIVDNIADILLVTDLQGRIQRVNKAAAAAFGADERALLGAQVRDLFRPRGGDAWIERLKRTGAPQKFDGELLGAAELPVQVSVSFLLDAEGERTGAVVVAHDMTLRRKYEAEMARSNEDLERFAFVASHDLQEPLRTISSYIQLVEARYSEKLGGEATRQVAFITDALARMRGLVRDLLEYSKLNSVLKAESVDSGAALDSVLAVLKDPIAAAGAEVRRGDLPVVLASRLHVERLLQNLVSNSVKFRDGRAPVVTVGARRDGAAWVFSVADNGEGIDSKYAGKLFKLFGRLHGAATQGAGIGLASCKRIVELYGGRIWFESVPGEGATFFFTLPAGPAGPAGARE